MNARTRKKTRTILMASICCLGILWLYTMHSLFSLPDVSHLRGTEPDSTAFMDAYDGDHRIRYRWVPLARISRYLQQAVVIAEDDQFWKHHGFNWEAIKAAAKTNWKRRSLSFGASTITQQLARNLFLSASKNPFRKLKELFIALKLERELPKERLLELYLNVVEWGDGIYGAEAAAHHYFGTTAAYLSPNQAAFLAAILPRPQFYDTHRNGPYLQRRIASIEKRL